MIMMMMMMMMITMMIMMMMMGFISSKTFFVGLLELKPYHIDRRYLKASLQSNQGIRKVGLLALKIILGTSPFLSLDMQYYNIRQSILCLEFKANYTSSRQSVH